MTNWLSKFLDRRSRRNARYHSCCDLPLGLESLENRRMLAVDLSTVVNNLGFEEYSGLPSGFSQPAIDPQMRFVDSWEALSFATTDYLHNDGFRGHENTQPTPSGEGFIGLVSKPRSHVSSPSSEWFEYAVNVLDAPLAMGEQYQFDLFLGTPPADDPFSRPPSFRVGGFNGEFAVFGLLDKTAIPFYSTTTQDIESFANGNVVELGKIELDLPPDHWEPYENFTISTPLDVEVEAIVFGTRKFRDNSNPFSFDETYQYLLVDAAPRSIDETPPQVTNVIVSNSGDASQTFDFVANDAHGSGKQILQLPYRQLNKIQIEFSEPVVVGANDLELISNNLADYQLVYQGLDASGTTATWQLATGNFESLDMILLDLSDSITDLAGNQLDGEWTNPKRVSTTNALVSEFPSGNGTAGGNFRFAITANIPGDVNGDNFVNSSDIGIVALNYGKNPTQLTGWLTNLPDDVVDSEERGEVLNNLRKGSIDWLLLGDLDGDYFVYRSDFLHQRLNWGGPDRTRADGDLNGDGIIDLADRLAILKMSRFRADFVD